MSSKYETSFYINAYSDEVGTSSPARSFVKWQRSLLAIPCTKPTSQEFYLAPAESKIIFDGTVATDQDGTTQYSISPKPLESGVYTLEWVGGQAPNFRTPRTTGADATTAATITVNGTVTTYTSSAGTPFNFTGGGVAVGDNLFVDGPFSPLNQGYFQVISFTATSISVVNADAVAETVVLGVDFAEDFEVFSLTGVQTTDTLRIFGGFSLVTLGSYSMRQVYSNRIDFFSTAALPTQTVTTDSIAIYSEARQLVYIETNKKISLVINGVGGGDVEPIFANGQSVVGQFLRCSTMWSMTITNTALEQAVVFAVTLE